MYKIRLNEDDSTIKEIETFSLNSNDEALNLRVISYCPAEKVESFLGSINDITKVDIFQDDNIIYSSTFWNALKNTYITYSTVNSLFEIQQTYEHI